MRRLRRRLRLGTDALSLALHALEIGPGDEVILPTFTFFATGGGRLPHRREARFRDIDPVTYNLDPFQVESKITPRTPRRFACSPVRPVRTTWKACGTSPNGTISVIIEDAAQSLGAEYQGKPPAVWVVWPVSAFTRPKTSAASATAAWL